MHIGCTIVHLTFIFIWHIIASDISYTFECQNIKCVKKIWTQQNYSSAVSLPVCKLFCGDTIGTLWPQPRGLVKLEQKVVQVNTGNIKFELPGNAAPDKFWHINIERFLKQLHAKIPEKINTFKINRLCMIKVIVFEHLTKEEKFPRISLHSDESYKLHIGFHENNVFVNVTSASLFGARHGLETLSQLFVYDDVQKSILIAAKAEITDSPAYKYRGVLLDTSRNWYSINAIKRTIDAMAMVKLNTFHWHIIDSQSFPMEIKSHPELYRLGAYSHKKVYTHEDVEEIQEYARNRGVRVLPEFDAPAHVGEGWQQKNMTVCFNVQPWNNFCVEPPCGQLDPTLEDMYEVLGDIYREMFELFEPDMFHMGGDEVSINCWNTSESIKAWMMDKGWKLDEKHFLKLWGYFQRKVLKKVDSVSKTKNISVILWTSRLTEEPFIDEFLDKDRYIIQVWASSTDPNIKKILKKGFKIIISNYDALYFDCGGASWVSEGNNWCSPYIGWQKVYENNLTNLGSSGDSRILGAEAAIWSEQIDEYNLDTRLWPRASALAERLWSNPSENWRTAESRFLWHRQRLVENGIFPEAIQPEWCLYNENECTTSLST